MRVSIYFIFLCFLLLKVGGSVAVLATSGSQGYALSPSLQENAPVHQAFAHNDFAIVNRAEDNNQDNYFFADDAEDEDANDLFARKFRLLARINPAFTYQPASGCPINRSKAAPAFFGRVSYKYLQQRVLRV